MEKSGKLFDKKKKELKKKKINLFPFRSEKSFPVRITPPIKFYSIVDAFKSFDRHI